jgi:multidrug efflux pump subunit AcrA (membrane-fusion protein)
VRPLALFLSLFVAAGCVEDARAPQADAAPTAAIPGPGRPAVAPAATTNREIRLTGVVEAIHASKVTVPQIIGQGGRLTLTQLIPNGARVRQGDVIAQFDPAAQFEAAFTAQTKFDDLGHQVDQKISQNRADAEKRRADLTQAQADLQKALLEVEKGPVVSDLDRLRNQEKADLARQHVESLTRTSALHDQSDAAALRILELQRDRQKVALDRSRINRERLTLRAPLPGLVAHQTVYRGNSEGHAQVGDQLWYGYALVSIFDPSEMQVRCMVAETDRALLKAGTRVMVRVDAYPDLAIKGHFESATPMAAAALGSPIKTFTAVFTLDATDPRLMPDLSAAVVIDPLAGSGAGVAE